MFLRMPLGKTPAASGSAIASPLSSLSMTAAMAGTALPMPRALSAVSTMVTSLRYKSTPGLSRYMPLTTGSWSSLATAAHTAPQAVP